MALALAAVAVVIIVPASASTPLTVTVESRVGAINQTTGTIVEAPEHNFTEPDFKVPLPDADRAAFLEAVHRRGAFA